MAKPGTSLPPWAEAGLYPASTYPLQLPWGVPNPVGGNPTPWSGLPRIDAAGLAAFADAGFTPQIPTPASPFNAYLNLVQQYIAWVEAGSNANDADAHIVESDSFGVVTAVAFESEFSYQGLGGTQAPLVNGAIINAGKTLTLTGDADILGTVSSVVTAGTVDTTSGGVVTTNDVTFYVDATPGGASGQVQWDGFRLSIAGDPVSAPIFDYKNTASTTAASTDIAGLDITAEVPDTRDVYITLEAHQSVDDVDNPLLRIRATNGVNSVAQLKLGAADAAVSILPTVVANARRPNSVRVRWRPTDDFPNPDNTTWTFFAQHGVTGLANLETTAAALKLEYR